MLAKVVLTLCNNADILEAMTTCFSNADWKAVGGVLHRMLPCRKCSIPQPRASCICNTQQVALRSLLAVERPLVATRMEAADVILRKSVDVRFVVHLPMSLYQ